MKAEAAAAAHRIVTPLPLVAPRWTTEVPAIEPIGEDAVKSRRESAEDLATRLQMQAVRDMARQRSARPTEPRPEEHQTETASAAREAAPKRRSEDPPTSAFHGVDVSLLPDEQFFRLTQALSRTAQSSPPPPSSQPNEEELEAAA